MSAIQNQILLKNQLAWKKRLVAESNSNEEQLQVEISELRNVKGFGDPTIAKLKLKGINTIKDLKLAMDNASAKDFQDTLTPIQFKQASNYFIEHPYDYI